MTPTRGGRIWVNISDVHVHVIDLVDLHVGSTTQLQPELFRKWWQESKVAFPQTK